MEFVKLRNGIQMPLVGFGTFRLQGRENVFKCVEAALQAGYRSIDTAVIYRNEEDIGLALEEILPKYQLNRSDLFITSKLSPRNQGYQPCLDSVQKSLQHLKTDYLDLYLIHWPGVSGKKVDDVQNSKLREGSWKALEHCYSSGTLKAIGVSNYTIQHLEEMKKYAETMPHVLQVEHHPHYNQTELLNYCKQNEIHFQAYSSLGTTVEEKYNQLLNDPDIKLIAESCGVSPARLLLRWSTQQQIGVLPKSTNPLHIAENIQLDFQIKDEDMERLNRLEIKHKYAWDPSVVA